MVNPYSCYVIAFLTALVLYPLGWSALYPPLSWELLLFLLLTIAIHSFAGLRFAATRETTFIKLTPDTNSALWITVFLYVLWLAEFLYEGGVPLFKILMNRPYDYRLFGIPTLHVFIVTFSSFYTIYLFHHYLSSRKKLVLALFLVNLFAAILIYSRAMFFFNASACFLMLLVKADRIPWFVLFLSMAGLAVLFYVFGVMGTLRVSREAGTAYNNRHFLQIGKARASFIESSVPKEYFWTYIYMTSPLANLQNNINEYPVENPNLRSAAEMINNEVLMDFISKRINLLLGTERAKEINIDGPFNVSTVYSRCYSYLGWSGMTIMGVVVIVLPLIYLKLIPPKSPFFLTGFAILCTMFLFLAYDNTIRFTGLSFQMVYPIVLHYGCRWLPRMRKIFL